MSFSILGRRKFISYVGSAFIITIGGSTVASANPWLARAALTVFTVGGVAFKFGFLVLKSPIPKTTYATVVRALGGAVKLVKAAYKSKVVDGALKAYGIADLGGATYNVTRFILRRGDGVIDANKAFEAPLSFTARKNQPPSSLSVKIVEPGRGGKTLEERRVSLPELRRGESYDFASIPIDSKLPDGSYEFVFSLLKQGGRTRHTAKTKVHAVPRKLKEELENLYV